MFGEQSWKASRSVETTRRLHAGLVGAGGERRDHVVRLPALELEVAVAERLDDRPEVRELLAQEVRHRPPALLVDDVRRLSDRGPVRRGRVPRDGDALGPVVREQLEEHVREAEESVRREAVARGELLREREEGAVREVVAVDEEELGVPSRPVVELQLLSGEGLRHRLKLSSRDDDAPRHSTIFRRVPAPRRRAPRGAPSRSPSGRAAAPGQVRERRSRSCRGRGAREERGSLRRCRPSRHARRRLPPRGAEERRHLGSERLGRDSPGMQSRPPRICATCTARRPTRWVEEGRDRHYALVPATDPAARSRPGRG